MGKDGVTRWVILATFTFVAGCTYMHISGDNNRVNVEKVGTEVDTDTEIDAEKKIE